MSKRKSKPKPTRYNQPYTDKSGVTWPTFNAYVRSHVPSASCAANGRKGFAATVEKMGRETAWIKAAAKRKAKPTKDTRKLVAVLDGLDLYDNTDYEREGNPFSDCFASVDFWLAGLRTIIQLHGPHHYAPTMQGFEYRQKRDAWLRVKCAATGIRLIEVYNTELADPVALGNRLGALLFVDEVPFNRPRDQELDSIPY